MASIAAAIAVLILAPQALAVSTVVATVRTDGSTTLTAGGHSVTTLRHGRYVLAIRDQSRSCGFRLSGALGVVAKTGVRFVGKISRRVDLVPGTYTYSCAGGHRHKLRVT